MPYISLLPQSNLDNTTSDLGLISALINKLVSLFYGSCFFFFTRSKDHGCFFLSICLHKEVKSKEKLGGGIGFSYPTVFKPFFDYFPLS